MFSFPDIDECSGKPCEPNGKCIDGVNSYTCECDAGYTGKHCETSKRNCSSNN
jgi:Notch-like protein